MSTRTIPEQKIVTCDICGDECDKKNRRFSGKITLKKDGLDLQGHAVGSDNTYYDACDKCLNVAAIEMSKLAIKMGGK